MSVDPTIDKAIKTILRSLQEIYAMQVMRGEKVLTEYIVETNLGHDGKTMVYLKPSGVVIPITSEIKDLCKRQAYKTT